MTSKDDDQLIYELRTAISSITDLPAAMQDDLLDKAEKVIGRLEYWRVRADRLHLAIDQVMEPLSQIRMGGVIGEIRRTLEEARD